MRPLPDGGYCMVSALCGPDKSSPDKASPDIASPDNSSSDNTVSPLSYTH